MISGPKEIAEEFLEGLTLIANMRMCANVPAQHAIQTALGGYQSINELIVPVGRFSAQSMLAHRLLNEIPGVTPVTPRGALYCFPLRDPEVYGRSEARPVGQPCVLTCQSRVSPT